MPRERFTYTVDFPGLRAPGLEVGRLLAAYTVTDYTASSDDRALAMRELTKAAVTMACRRLAAEQPELLQFNVAIPRVECSLELRLPTWFTGTPPERLVRLLSDAMAQSAAGAGREALADLAVHTVDELDPEEKLALKPVYEAAAAALQAGDPGRGAQLLRQAEQKRAWHQAALAVAADLPQAARGLRAVPAVAALAAPVEPVVARATPQRSGATPSVDGRAPGAANRPPAATRPIEEAREQGLDPSLRGSNPSHRGSNPSQTGSTPLQTGSPPPQTGSNPSQTGSNPTQTGSDPTQTGSNLTHMGSNPTHMGSSPTQPSPNPTFLGATPAHQPSHSGSVPLHIGGKPKSTAPTPEEAGAVPPSAAPASASDEGTASGVPIATATIQPRPTRLTAADPEEAATPAPDWWTALAADIEALMQAPGEPYLKAILLAAIAGPLPADALPLSVTGRPPAPGPLTKPQARAATRALKAYLAGMTPAQALQQARRRR